MQDIANFLIEVKPPHWMPCARPVCRAVCCLMGFGLAIAMGLAQPNDEREVSLPAQRVTLVGRMKLDEALVRLNEQFHREGNRLEDLRPSFGQPVDNPEVELNLRDATFWQACDQLAQAAGLRLAILPPTAERNTTVGLVAFLSDTVRATPPTVYSGPFRVRIVELHAVRHFEDPRLSHLEANVEWACEPRYLPIWLRVQRDSVRWRDAHSPELVAEQAGQGTVQWLGEGALRWRIRLPLPERNLPRLPSLSLSVQALIAPKRLMVQLPLAGRPKPIRVEDVRVSLLQAEYDSAREQWRLQLRLDYPPSDGQRGFELESHHTWVMNASQFWLQAKDREPTYPPIRPPIVSVEGQHSFTLDLHFPALAKSSPSETQNWELRGLIPATPRRVPIHVTFRDVPLP